MTQDEIIEMARQAGIIAIHTEGDGNWHQQFVALKAFYKLVAAKEREECAKICSSMHTDGDDDTGFAAEAIRARAQAERGET